MKAERLGLLVSYRPLASGRVQESLRAYRHPENPMISAVGFALAAISCISLSRQDRFCMRVPVCAPPRLPEDSWESIIATRGPNDHCYGLP